MNSVTGTTLSISGDYLKAPNPGSLNITAAHNFTFSMTGTTAQSVEVVDPINSLTITNNSTVNFTEAFTIRTALTLSGTTTTLNINEDLTYSNAAGTVTIPAGNTVNIAAGKTLYMSGNLVVNGTLRLNPGSQILIDSGRTITVNSGGQLRLEGASGNIASVVGNGGYYNLAVAGTLYADYFRFSKVGTDLRGVYVSGTLSKFDNGEVIFINNNGYGLTLGPAASIPATIHDIGFFDNAAYGTAKNINATGFNVSNMQIDEWSGLDLTFETDPNNRLNWGAQVDTSITVAQNTNTGMPVSPVTAGAAAGEWIIFSFALNQISAASDITSLTLTLTGTADTADVDYVAIYQQAGTCQTRGAQIGTNQTLSGSPGTATFTIPASTLTVSDTTAVCVHAYLKTSSGATNNATVGLSIASTADVVNSFGYTFSPTSGPPVQSGLATIAGSATSTWDGSNGTTWTQGQNWTPAGAPTNTQNCIIGTGAANLGMDGNRACLSVTLSSGGTINWNTAAHTLSVYSSLEVQSGYTFLNATTGTMIMAGATNQTLSMATAWPGNLTINNSGGVSSIISVTSNSTINGNLTVTSGTLKINSGVTFTVLGNITVQTGAVLDIESGGTLALANGRTLTVDAGGTLEMIGTGSNATITSISTANAYNVVINGTIKADKYVFSRLNTNGVTINSGATIDATYKLSNGSFTYPVNNSTTFLRLFKAIPGNSLSGIEFSTGGSAATPVTNIYTDASIGAGTLDMNSYLGDLAGTAYDNPNTYLINWVGAANKIVLTQAATSPTNVNSGQVGVVMGRYSFNQKDVGSTDVDLSSIKLTLTGTGAASYIDAVKIYYDDNCDSAGGVLLGTGTYSGSPATVTFSSLSGVTIPASLTTPPSRCVYVTYDIASSAPNSSTLGVSIAASGDVTDSLTWGISNIVTFPVTLGTPSTVIGTSTSWTGAVSTVWTNAANWTGGVPTALLNCTINSAANNPIISAGTQSCKSLTIGNGNLTINVGTSLEIYGALSNSGTLTNSGTITLRDDGVSISNHALSLNSTLNNVVISNNLGGAISWTGAITINGLTMNGTGSGAYDLNVGNGRVLNLPSGVTINGGSLNVSSGGAVNIGNGQTMTVSGGRLWLNGTSEAAPQTLSTKAKIGVITSGTWNFNSTSGTLRLEGFHLDYIGTNGLVVGGTTTLSHLNGGQFTNLSNTYASVKAIQINTSGSIPATSNNVGWNWTPNNTTPASSDGYIILSSTGCGNQSMDFSGWFGDWADDVPTFDVSTKVSQSNCNLSLGAMASAVNMLSFTATPYKKAIDLKWETINESNHLGFNVFREDYSGNLVQINPSLIRNIKTPGTLRGKYRFIDRSVENDVRYYYYVQDVSTNSGTKLHGPVSAIAKSTLGNPPANQPTENSGGNTEVGDTPPGSTIPNPTYNDLGDGVTILSQSDSNIRLKIVPDAPQFTVSTWNGSYKSVHISGYSKQTRIGHPETLQKSILIEVNPDYSTATVESNTLSTSVLAGHRLQPAPSYVLVGGNLVAQYALNATAYAQNNFGLEDYFKVESALITIGERKYLKVDIKPLFQNPVASQLKMLNELILDISLNGNGWAQIPPTYQSSNRAYITNNALAFTYTSSGMYELTYDQLVDSNVDGPFDGINLNSLRLFHLESEIPIEILSADGLFNSGDKIRFYLEYHEYHEHSNNVAVLTTVNLNSTSALRISALDGDPAGRSLSPKLFETHEVTAESNDLALLSLPVGEEEDHFYWSQIFTPTVSGPQDSYKNLSVNLDGLDPTSNTDVVLSLYLKGANGNSPFTKHSLEVYVNNVITPLADIVLENQDPTVSIVSIPSYYFFPGTNTVRIKVTGELTLPGEYDIVYINKLKAQFPRSRYVTSDYLVMKNTVKDAVVSFEGFSTSALNIYDVSTYDDTRVIDNALIQDLGGVYSISFNTNDDGEFLLGRKYAILSDTQFKKASELNLISGSKSLKDTTNQADYIIIAEKKMIPHLSEYVDYKKDQGLKVKVVGLERIFQEFAFGRRSPEAIKAFLNYAKSSWKAPTVRYVLVIGDTSYDPKDHLEFGNTHHKVPGKFVKGMVYDYLSDHWFTTKDSVSHAPQMSIGRLPSNDPEAIRGYLNKVMDYENGVASPEGKKLRFFSTKSESLENFEGKVTQLENLDALKKAKFTSTHLSHESVGLTPFNQSILHSFDQNNLFVTFMGHGAEDRWAHESGNVHLSNANAAALNNSKLPIVLALNCLNASFQEPDEATLSISEKLIFNKDGGAIAFLGSNSMTTAMAQQHFATNLFTELGNVSKQGNKAVRLGDVMTLTKLGLGSSGYNRDALYSYHLIGDPSLKFPDKFFVSKAPVTGETKVGGSGGGGCSKANASTGDRNEHFLEGILELLFMAFIYIIARRITRRIRFQQGG